MDFFPFILSLFLVLHLSGQSVTQVEAHHHHHHHHHKHHRHHISKLFVFGDSYVDTGNIKRGLANSWKEPYGITFPGKPAGRFSDGRVFTDYIAKYLKLKSPVPYSVRELMPKHLKYGMNFAFGGTGVFRTLFSGPNMTTQIDFFEQQIKDKLYSTKDIRNSVALVSVAGNDYTFYNVKNGSVQGFPSFVAALINQTVINLIRIKELGVKKVIMSGLQPIGCLPQQTAGTSFKQCNETSNTILASHNNLLRQAINKLNQQTNDTSSPFLFLNLHDTFMSVLNHPTTFNIKDKLKPCCVGVSNEYFCGSVDEKNVKKYLVCEEPKSAFFWDSVHPTEAGWHAVYNKLRITNALEPIYY